MRKIFLAFVLTSLVITSCGQTKTDKQVSTENLPTEVNTEQFIEQIIDFRDKDWRFLGDQPVVIDFYASWCPPCKKLSPILDELSQEYKGKVKFYKVNVDNEPDLVKVFDIKSMPTLVYVALNGDLTSSIGYMTKKKLIELIEENLLDK
ncbi:MAG: thioredoxin [Rikenellaceae bacterium]